jgi:hypothetical protein
MSTSATDVRSGVRRIQPTALGAKLRTGHKTLESQSSYFEPRRSDGQTTLQKEKSRTGAGLED